MCFVVLLPVLTLFCSHSAIYLGHGYILEAVADNKGGIGGEHKLDKYKKFAWFVIRCKDPQVRNGIGILMSKKNMHAAPLLIKISPGFNSFVGIFLPSPSKS